MNNYNGKAKKGKKENYTKQTIKVKSFEEDLTDEINNEMGIILLVEHSKSFVKQNIFDNYITNIYKGRADKYIIVKMQADFITLDKIKPESVVAILKEDINKKYNELMQKYPNASIKRAYSFNYALDYNEKARKAEIMSIALLRTSETYALVQYSPIISIPEEKYFMLMGKYNDTEEGKLLNDIILEKVIGNELFGLIGYLTDGKYNTANLYTENLLDILPQYKDVQKARSKNLKYKKYNSTTEKYLSSLKKEVE